MDKSPDAFRTISEVADWLDTPTHVLRFWESRFTQVKPVKRAGGRRYYRPSDMELLGGIKQLLHNDGMTIRGVQKLLREEGIKHVAAMSPPLDSDLEALSEAAVVDGTALPDKSEAKPAPMITNAPQDAEDNVVALPRTPPEADDSKGELSPDAAKEPEVEPEKEAPESAAAAEDAQPDLLSRAETGPEAGSEAKAEAELEPRSEQQAKAKPAAETEPEPRDEPEPASQSTESTAAPEEPESQPAAKAPAPRPAIVDVPPDPEDDDTSLPGITDVAAELRKASTAAGTKRPAAADLQRVYEQLVKLRDRMTADERN